MHCLPRRSGVAFFRHPERGVASEIRMKPLIYLSPPFQLPISITPQAWQAAVDWSAEDSKAQIHQTTQDRLQDMLWSVAWTIEHQGDKAQVAVDHYCVPRDGQSTDRQRMTLQASLSSDARQLLIHLPEEPIDMAPPASGQVLIGALRSCAA